METQEIQSVEEGTQIGLYKQAAPYILSVRISKDKVEDDLNTEWQKIKESLPTNAFKGFRVGSDAIRPLHEKKYGITQIYSRVWLKCVDEAAAQKKQSFPIDLKSLDVSDTGNYYMIQSVLYFLPDCEWKNEESKTQPIQIKMKKQSDDSLDKVVAGRLEQMKKSYLKWEKFEGPADDACKVNINIEATVDNKVWEDGSESDHVIQVGNIAIPELREALQGVVAGQDLMVSADLSKFKLPAGTQYSAKIHVNEVLKSDGPLSDEQLAERSGKTVEDLVAGVRAKELAQVEESDQKSKEMLAMHELRRLVEVSPVPFEWTMKRASEESQSALQRMKKQGVSESEALQNYGFQTLADFTSYCANQISDKVREEAILVEYARVHNMLDLQKSVTQNCALAKKHLMDNTVVEWT